MDLLRVTVPVRCSVGSGTMGIEGMTSGQLLTGMWYFHKEAELEWLDKSHKDYPGKVNSYHVWLGHISGVFWSGFLPCTADVNWIGLCFLPALAFGIRTLLYLSWQVIYSCTLFQFNFKWHLSGFYCSCDAIWKEKCIIGMSYDVAW